VDFQHFKTTLEQVKQAQLVLTLQKLDGGLPVVSLSGTTLHCRLGFLPVGFARKQDTIRAGGRVQSPRTKAELVDLVSADTFGARKFSGQLRVFGTQLLNFKLVRLEASKFGAID
jgi:hypothetical protein